METKTHLVLVGFGQNRIHLIPAVMAICNDLPELKVTIIDKKSFESIIGESRLLTEEQTNWCKERFVQENGGSEVVTDNLLLREILRTGYEKGFQRIFYLSLPPDNLRIYYQEILWICWYFYNRKALGIKSGTSSKNCRILKIY